MSVRRTATARPAFARSVAAGLLGLAIALAPALGASAAPAASTARSADASTPVSLAVLVPLTVRPTASGLIDASTLAAYTAPLGVLTRQLDAVAGTPAVIGLDPMILASIRVLGTSAPASAIAWLERLRTADNQVFALAYADADLASLARVGRLDLAAPTGFDYAIDPSHFGPAVTATPTATSTATPAPTPSPTPTSGGSTTPPLPSSTADVLDWSYTLQNVAWPAEDTVNADEIAPLAAAGYQDVVLSSANLSATASGQVDLGKLHGIVSDAGVSSLVREATYAVGGAAAQDALGRLNTALAGMQAVSPGRTVVATLDRHWPLGSLNLTALFADLAVQTGVSVAGLTSVLAGPAPSAQVTTAADDAARDAQITSVIATVQPEIDFASAAATPALVLEPRRLQLLSLLAVSWLRGTDDWTTQVQAFLTASANLTSSVQVVRGSDLFVGAGHTNIPVTVSNALTVPVTVYVTLSSTSSRLQIQKQDVALTIPPQSSNKAAIPVQALTNGNAIAAVTITSASGVRIGAVDYVNVDLQPGWESVGTTVIIVLLVLVFGGGIARNIYKRRAAKRAAADPAGD